MAEVMAITPGAVLVQQDDGSFKDYKKVNPEDEPDAHDCEGPNPNQEEVAKGIASIRAKFGIS